MLHGALNWQRRTLTINGPQRAKQGDREDRERKEFGRCTQRQRQRNNLRERQVLEKRAAPRRRRSPERGARMGEAGGRERRRRRRKSGGERRATYLCSSLAAEVRGGDERPKITTNAIFRRKINRGRRWARVGTSRNIDTCLGRVHLAGYGSHVLTCGQHDPPRNRLPRCRKAGDSQQDFHGREYTESRYACGGHVCPVSALISPNSGQFCRKSVALSRVDVISARDTHLILLRLLLAVPDRSGDIFLIITHVGIFPYDK